jgi:hypothetical protein
VVKINGLTFVACKLEIASVTRHQRPEVLIIIKRWITKVIVITGNDPSIGVDESLQFLSNVERLGIVRRSTGERAVDGELHDQRHSFLLDSAISQTDRTVRQAHK